jgi:hypothetical protein
MNITDPIMMEILHQWFNFTLRLVNLSGYNRYGEIDHRNIRYGLGVYVVIGDKEILIKKYKVTYADMAHVSTLEGFPVIDYKNETDISILRMQEERQNAFTCEECRKILMEKYVPMAKAYMEIKAEEHLRAEMRVAKELGFDYKPFFAQTQQ